MKILIKIKCSIINNSNNKYKILKIMTINKWIKNNKYNINSNNILKAEK